jgi:DNA-binding NtrC family response regulator
MSKMPGMDGIETLGPSRARCPLVEVIMLTGHATVETAIEGMKLGAYDYLMKPCDMDLLLIAKVERGGRQKAPARGEDHQCSDQRDHIEAARRPGNGSEPQSFQRSKRSDIRLLMVDDEKGFVEVLAKRLAKRNIIATQAYSGTEGIQLLRRIRFRCGRAGPEAGGHGRDRDPENIQENGSRSMPVIMLTGHGSEKASREGMRYGAFDYLTKPHELAELVDKINEAVHQGKRTEGNHETPSGG